MSTLSFNLTFVQHQSCLQIHREQREKRHRQVNKIDAQLDMDKQLN